jgi:hypothetical protein
MGKPILIRPNSELSRLIREAAKTEKRKPGPTVLILLEEALKARQAKEQVSQ